MPLPKAHHIETLNEFNSLKFSYDSTNTHYFTGGTDTIVEGTPDILYTDIAYIKPLSAIYTHAKIYPCPILEYDNAPTAGSTNLVNSGNIKNAIDTRRVYFGTSNTAGDEAIKVITTDVDFPTTTVNDEIVPMTGVVIAIKPTVADDGTRSGYLKFKVNNCKALPLWYSNSEFRTMGSSFIQYGVGSHTFYAFNGTHWVWISQGYDRDTQYTPQSLGFGYASCTTAAATAAKTATLSSYSLVNNGLVVVYFQYDVPANATLNINSKGAKEIHFQNARITSGVIKAGDKCLFIYNGNYMLIAIDRWGKELQEKVSGINISETDFEALSDYEQGKLYFVYDDNNS